MATARDILKVKGTHVYSIGVGTTVLDAAVMMNDNHIGALIVLDAGAVKGIFTERDVLRRVVAIGRNPSEVLIDEVMTRNIAFCRNDTTVEEARSVFKNRRIRHLPVFDEQEQMVGMISIGDLNAHKTDEQETTIRYLHEYLYGSV